MTQTKTATSRVLTALRVLPATMLLAGMLSLAPGVGAEATDSDGDGLFDQDEISVYFTNPQVADSDGDGSNDGEEIYYGTDPLVANAAPVLTDTDGDGLYDQDEAAVYGTDPNNPDTDGDGSSDGAEVYDQTDPLAGANPAPDPAAPGTAGDGFTPDPAVIIPDAVGGADLVDSDGDGLTDGDEGRRGTNPTSFDSDGDGLRDGEEVNVYGTNPLDRDSDDDGLIDWEDIVANQGQPAGDAMPLPGDPAPQQNEPMDPAEPVEPPQLPEEGNPCRIEGACGGGVPHNNEEGPHHQHCFLEDQMDPNRTGYCGNV